MNALLSLSNTQNPASTLLPREHSAGGSLSAAFSAFLELAAAGETVTGNPLIADASLLETGVEDHASLTFSLPGELLPLPPGTGLPPPAATGKFLPQDLPAETDAQESEQPAIDALPAPLAPLDPLSPPPLLPLALALLQAVPSHQAAGDSAQAHPPATSAAAFVPAMPAPVVPLALTPPQAAPLHHAAGDPAQAHLPAASAATFAATMPTPAIDSKEAPAVNHVGATAPAPTAPEAQPSPPTSPRGPAVTVMMGAAPAQLPAHPATAGAPVEVQLAAGTLRGTAELTDPRRGDGQAPSDGADHPARSPDLRLPGLAASALVENPSSRSLFAQTAPAVPPAPPAPLASAPAPVPAMQPDAVKELAAIVERLAVAREFASPAAAVLSLEHGEFGPMTLRFEQQKDGQLTVGLSAATPEAHRAVAAALAAERMPTGGERPAAEGQQQNNQPRAGGNGSGLDRGAGGSAGSGTGGGHNGNSHPGSGHQRHDSPREHHGQERWPAAGRRQNFRGGVYA